MLYNKRRYTIGGLIFFIIPLLVGLFLIRRGTIDKSNMKAVTGKVVSKSINSIYSFKGGRHYFLVFEIENLPTRIAINYATESQARNDSAVNLVDIGNTYTFYLDPTYPTDNNQDNGIDVIEHNGLEIYRISKRANLYAGFFFILFGSTLFFLIIRYKRKENSS
jgi:hypothetical protein